MGSQALERLTLRAGQARNPIYLALTNLWLQLRRACHFRKTLHRLASVRTNLTPPPPMGEGTSPDPSPENKLPVQAVQPSVPPSAPKTSGPLGLDQPAQAYHSGVVFLAQCVSIRLNVT